MLFISIVIVQKCFFFQSLCGIRDAITFKEIDDTHINQVEKYVQSELDEVLSTWKLSGIEINETDFYGDVYVHSPKAFKFTIGDRMQIQMMVNYVKMKYDGNGVEFSGAHYFGPYASKKPKPKSENGQLKSFFGNNSKQKSATKFKSAESLTDEMKQLLIDKIANIYTKHGIDSQIVGKLNIEQVQFQEDAEGKIRVLFKCPLCSTSNKENCFVLHTKSNILESSSTKVYWVLSNYTKHVQMHVKNTNKYTLELEKGLSTENLTEMDMFDGNGTHTESVLHILMLRICLYFYDC